jgi:hypothetical protein
LETTFLAPVDIKIDDIMLNFTPFTDEEQDEAPHLDKWNTQYVEGYVLTEARTKESRVTAWFHGAGNAYNIQTSSRTCTAD